MIIIVRSNHRTETEDLSSKMQMGSIRWAKWRNVSGVFCDCQVLIQLQEYFCKTLVRQLITECRQPKEQKN